MTLRLRLAAWAAGVLALALLAVSLLVYTAVRLTLQSDLAAALDGQARHVAAALPLAPRPPYLAPSRIRQTIALLTTPDTYLQVTDPAGHLIARSAALGAATLPGGQLPLTPTGKATIGGDVLLLRRVPLTVSGRTVAMLIVARSVQPISTALGALKYGLPAVGAAAVVLVVGATLVVTRRALRPIAAMTEATRAIARAQDFGRRLGPAPSRDEVGRLAQTFDEMLASLEAAYVAQQRFVADASHELRAPLTPVPHSCHGAGRRPPPCDRHAATRQPRRSRRGGDRARA